MYSMHMSREDKMYKDQKWSCSSQRPFEHKVASSWNWKWEEEEQDFWRRQRIKAVILTKSLLQSDVHVVCTTKLELSWHLFVSYSGQLLENHSKELKCLLLGLLWHAHITDVFSCLLSSSKNNGVHLDTKTIFSAFFD